MKAWIAVAAAEHVRIGRKVGFMQVCHGKAAPLRRLCPGDPIAYYSPTVTFKGKDTLQAFTAIGIIRDTDPYQTDMGRGFCPYRRDVDWFDAREHQIRPLLDDLAFTAGKTNWGYKLRFGLFDIPMADMMQIACAMGANLLARVDA
jgi:hypothetical protein